MYHVKTFLAAAANAGHPHHTAAHIALWVAHSHVAVRALAIRSLHGVATMPDSQRQPPSATSPHAHERKLADEHSAETAATILARVAADQSLDIATRLAALHGFHNWHSISAEATDMLQQALLVELEVGSLVTSICLPAYQ